MRSLFNGRSRTRVAVSLVGLLLVPLTIAGVLTWALGSSEDQVGGVKAAIVNNDEPVKVDGQLTPLGRQMSAKLVGDEINRNYDWEFANPQTAADGLEDGTYGAVVTIPENFSAAATSFSGDPDKAHKAKIDVNTGEHDRPADQAISRQLTSTATKLLGNQLTTTYLDNLYVGFNTLGDQLGSASDGATSLDDGADQLASGTNRLADGADQLAGGSNELSTGLGQLNDGATQLTQGVNGLSDGLGQMRKQTEQLPEQVGQLADVSDQESSGVQQLNTQLQDMSQELGEMSEQCPPGTLPLCNKIAVQAAKSKALAKASGQVQQASDGISTGLDGMAGRTPDADGGLPALAAGIDQLSSGANQLNDGATQLSDGLGQTTEGADGLAHGADQLADGIRGVSDGATELSDGSGQLSNGLQQAVDQLPNYPQDDRDQLAQTVADPVTTNDEGTTAGFGSSGVPMYAVLALWVGALATFLVLPAVPGRVLESIRSTPLLALRQFTLPAGLATVQGLLVSAVLGWSQHLSAGQWSGAAGVLVLAALAFTAVNQALSAFGGIGRFVSMVVALLTIATGFISAIPPLLDQVAGVLPVDPTVAVLRSVLSGSAPSGSGVTALVMWLLGGLFITYLAVERNRTVRAANLRGGGALSAHTSPA